MRWLDIEDRTLQKAIINLVSQTSIKYGEASTITDSIDLILCLMSGDPQGVRGLYAGTIMIDIREWFNIKWCFSADTSMLAGPLQSNGTHRQWVTSAG